MDLDAGYDIEYVNDMWNRIMARLPTPPLDNSFGSSLPDINTSGEASQNSTQFNLEIDNDNVDSAADNVQIDNEVSINAETIDNANANVENQESNEEASGEHQIPESYYEVSKHKPQSSTIHYYLLQNELDVCSICLEIVDTDGSIHILECGHIFHTDCVTTWIDMKTDPDCPNCR